MKTCNECKESKDIEEFHQDCTKKDGRQRMCKKCRSEYYQKNREAIEEQKRKYYQRNKKRIMKRKKERDQQYRELSRLYQAQNIQGITFSEFREKMRNMKTCTKCNESKDIEEFQKDSRAPDGKRSQCKKCHKAYYQNNKVRLLERSKEYYRENREKKKEYWEKNRIKHREYTREWIRKNPDRIAERKERDKKLSKIYQSENIHGISFGDFRKKMAGKPL